VRSGANILHQSRVAKMSTWNRKAEKKKQTKPPHRQFQRVKKKSENYLRSQMLITKPERGPLSY